MKKLIKNIENIAEEYERGRMMRDDSEVEIDDLDGELWLCDYSENRGDAEPVKMLCSTDDVEYNDIVSLCNKHSWAYCL